jgi:pimeloyl-ACP methyl ester carboxylesterase
VDAVLGVTDLVESVHRTVLSVAPPIGRPVVGRTGGITGFVYGAVRGVTRGVGWGLDTALGAPPARTDASTPEREALLAALNGAWGDHLEATGNPLAIPMSLRVGGRPWRNGLREAGRPVTGRLVVQIHGLGMNDLQWRRDGHDHGDVLAEHLGYTPVHLHHNSGRSIADNGAGFAALLDGLIEDWPVPVERLVLLGHSMGGLIARSACWHGADRAWMRHLSDIVCLGSPHHGAPLERGGRLIDAALGLSPYAAPFARLGGTRSAGVQDLRHGRLRPPSPAEDGAPSPTPLPPGVRCHVVAAILGEGHTAGSTRAAATRWLCDGLVPLASALGEHADEAFDLQIPTDRRLVVEGAHHWDLLNRAEVSARLRQWLA